MKQVLSPRLVYVQCMMALKGIHMSQAQSTAKQPPRRSFHEYLVYGGHMQCDGFEGSQRFLSGSTGIVHRLCGVGWNQSCTKAVFLDLAGLARHAKLNIWGTHPSKRQVTMIRWPRGQ